MKICILEHEEWSALAGHQFIDLNCGVQSLPRYVPTAKLADQAPNNNPNARAATAHRQKVHPEETRSKPASAVYHRCCWPTYCRPP